MEKIKILKTASITITGLIYAGKSLNELTEQIKNNSNLFNGLEGILVPTSIDVAIKEEEA